MNFLGYHFPIEYNANPSDTMNITFFLPEDCRRNTHIYYQEYLYELMILIRSWAYIAHYTGFGLGQLEKDDTIMYSDQGYIFNHENNSLKFSVKINGSPIEMLEVLFKYLDYGIYNIHDLTFFKEKFEFTILKVLIEN